MKDEEKRKDELQRAFAAVHDRIRHSMVLLGRDTSEDGRAPDPGGSDLRGSGILVQTEDGRKGVLTAGHCVEQDRRNTMILVAQANAPGRIVPYPIPNANAIVHRSGREYDVPDLALFPLSPEQGNRMEAQGGICHRVGRQRLPASETEPGKGKPAWSSLIASGWPGVLREVMPAKSVGYVLESMMDVPREDIREKHGWDYADHIFEDKESIRTGTIQSIHMKGLYELAEEANGYELTGKSRGGYSGGGLWRVWWIEDEDDYRVDLEGIMFYQWPENTKGQRKMRVHQTKSIARILEIEPWSYSPLRGAAHQPDPDGR